MPQGLGLTLVHSPSVSLLFLSLFLSLPLSFSSCILLGGLERNMKDCQIKHALLCFPSLIRMTPIEMPVNASNFKLQASKPKP